MRLILNYKSLNLNKSMATVKPFKGVRPPQDLVEQIASRPYDVLDSEEARAEAGDNEKSLYHIIKPEIDFEPGSLASLSSGSPVLLQHLLPSFLA